MEAEEPVPSWVLAFGGLGIVIGLVRSVCVLRLARARVGLAIAGMQYLPPRAPTLIPPTDRLGTGNSFFTHALSLSACLRDA